MPSACRSSPASPARAVGGHRPLHRQIGEIGERIAERGELPIEHRRERPVAVEHRVVDAVVTVDDRGTRLLGQGLRQERDQPFHLGDVVGLRVAILPRPPCHLALEIIARFAEIGEVGGAGVDAVQLGERVDQLLVHAAAGGRIEVGQRAVRIRAALRDIHDVEDSADDARVVAQGERLGNRETERVKGSEQPVFAVHRMCRRKQRPERLAPKDIFT